MTKDEDRLFAGAPNRNGSFVAGVNTVGQGVIILQLDNRALADMETNHAFARAVTFTNVEPAALPAFVTSRFAGPTLAQYKVTPTTQISVASTSVLPMLYTAKLRYPTYNAATDKADAEDKYPADGSALLVVPHGKLFRGGPFRKFNAWVACGNPDAPDLGCVELAVKQSAPDNFVAQLQAAADDNTPLYIYAAKISAPSNTQYNNSIFLNGALVAAAAAPGKRPPKRVQTFRAATQQTTAATDSRADTNDMMVAWEQRDRAAVVLPSDGAHAAATLSPNPSSVTTVGSRPVIPLVLSVGNSKYPVCTDSPSVLQQLPNYADFFADASFADDNDRVAYTAYDSFAIAGTVTTSTEGRTTFVTALQQ